MDIQDQLLRFWTGFCFFVQKKEAARQTASFHALINLQRKVIAIAKAKRMLIYGVPMEKKSTT